MDYLLGQLLLLTYLGNWAPRSTLKCEGQLLQISNNQALYSLLGTKFGGNGITTFAWDKCPAHFFAQLRTNGYIL